MAVDLTVLQVLIVFIISSCEKTPTRARPVPAGKGRVEYTRGY